MIRKTVSDSFAVAAAFVVVVQSILPPAHAAASSGGSCAATAADIHAWGTPVRSDDFGDPSSLAGWNVYDAPGHNGNGVRTPYAVSVTDGIFSIVGTSFGQSGGAAWLPGRTYGRWETCARSLAGSANYHPVILLWPDSERWPEDGEIDFMEISDAPRQRVTATVHHATPNPVVTYGPQNQGAIDVDATQWHSWAVEWEPDHVAGFIDGREWFRISADVPRTPMHLCIQLDNMGNDIAEGGRLDVDYVREYGQ